MLTPLRIFCSRNVKVMLPILNHAIDLKLERFVNEPKYAVVGPGSLDAV